MKRSQNLENPESVIARQPAEHQGRFGQPGHNTSDKTRESVGAVRLDDGVVEDTMEVVDEAEEKAEEEPVDDVEEETAAKGNG